MKLLSVVCILFLALINISSAQYPFDINPVLNSAVKLSSNRINFIVFYIVIGTLSSKKFLPEEPLQNNNTLYLKGTKVIKKNRYRSFIKQKLIH